MVREEIPGTTLHIFGKYDPSCRARIDERIELHDLHEAVSLEGWKSPEYIHDIIAATDIGIVPYLRNDFMELALSTKTFEYAASGLPVVASRLDPVTSVFDDAAIAYFEPGDPRGLADAVIALCREPDRREHMAKLASEVVEPICGAVMAERYVDLVEDLVGCET